VPAFEAWLVAVEFADIATRCRGLGGTAVAIEIRRSKCRAVLFELERCSDTPLWTPQTATSVRDRPNAGAPALGGPQR